MPIASLKRFEQMQERVVAHLLPQTARIYPKVLVITSSGATSGQTSRGDPLTYHGIPDIPCRLDSARHYRVDEVAGQELIVNEHELHVPEDAPLPVNHEIVIDGRSYEVRKEYDYGIPWVITKYAIVTELRLGADDA